MMNSFNRRSSFSPNADQKHSIDNIEFLIVPEPAAWAVFSLIGFTWVHRRRMPL